MWDSIKNSVNGAYDSCGNGWHNHAKPSLIHGAEIGGTLLTAVTVVVVGCNGLQSIGVMDKPEQEKK